ncbi:MAG: DUF1007 family protein, partial [Rubricella sp.]
MNRAVATALIACFAASPLAAHPHVFLDARYDPIMDAEGRLTGFEIHWIYDELTSFYVLDALALDFDYDGVLTEAEEAVLIADQMTWDPRFTGFARVPGGVLGDPVPGTAALLDGKISVTFRRNLAEPVPIAGTVGIPIYDGEYYIAVALEGEPVVTGPGAGGCTARVVP